MMRPVGLVPPRPLGVGRPNATLPPAAQRPQPTFGLTPPTDPPQLLEVMPGWPETYSAVLYHHNEDLQNRMTLYMRAHPSEKAAMHDLAQRIARRMQEEHPGLTVTVKDFEDRPANALVLEIESDT